MFSIKIKILITITFLSLVIGVKAESQRSAEQRQRGTTALPSSGADEFNSVTHRILRRGTFQGKFWNIVRDGTMFVVTTGYKTNKYGYVTHDCIFLVKGNLTLPQIVEGDYPVEDIVNMSCDTKYSSSL